MTTGNDLVCGALRVISSLSPGEAIPGAEADNALQVLNWMMAAWSAESLMPPYRTLESFPLTIGKTTYVIGQTGSVDFNTVRPDEITWAYRRDFNNIDYPLALINKELYNSLQMKSLDALPYQLYYDTQYPNGIIYIWPADMQADTLFIESLKPVNQFTTLQTVMNLPGEYQEAIKYLLAKRLAVEYGFEIAPGSTTDTLIKEAEHRIMRKNTKPKSAIFDLMILAKRPYNIYSDGN